MTDELLAGCTQATATHRAMTVQGTPGTVRALLVRVDD